MHMIKRLQPGSSASLFYPNIIASGLAVSLMIFQALVIDEYWSLFLVWNLFLAWIPYLMALWAEASARRSIWRAILPSTLWLLFLPNAPYIMTDFIHLGEFGLPWWYEVGMLLAFAWAGCLLGVASLFIMQRIIRKRLGVLISWGFVFVSCGLSGLGIYLGRFLRWNSWDVIFNPRYIAHDLLHLFGNPAHYPQMIGVSGLFACFLGLGYLTLSSARRM